jgi:molecular chaperone DnaJ
VNGYGTGDLKVYISVYIPETLSRDERNAMEKFQKSDNFRPNESLKDKIFRKFKSLFD